MMVLPDFFPFLDDLAHSEEFLKARVWLLSLSIIYLSVSIWLEVGNI